METLLIRYGLLAVFIGGAVEGDVTFILAGVVVHLGLLNLPTAIVAGTLGAFAGDCFWYWLARNGSARLRESKSYQRAEPMADRLAARYGAWELVLARFIFGARLASSVFRGMRGLSFRRFALIDLLGCLVWAIVLIPLGWWLSNRAMLLVGEVRRLELWLLGALILSVVVFLFFRFIVRRLMQVNKSVTPTGDKTT